MRDIVILNGTFRLGLMYHHVMMFKWAKEQFPDFNNVALVNSTKSIQKIKPYDLVLPDEERYEMISSCKYIDDVVFFDEETPLEAIKNLNPLVLVKGADYKDKEIVGADHIRSYGGTVELFPLMEGKSTSWLEDKIIRSKFAFRPDNIKC